MFCHSEINENQFTFGFEQRIAAKLGDPRTDPHGHSIPTMEGKMPRGERLVRESIVLADVVEEDGTYVVDSVADRDAHNLRLIEACGITPGARLRVRKIASSGGYSVRTGRSSKAVELSREVALDVRIVRRTK